MYERRSISVCERASETRSRISRILAGVPYVSEFDSRDPKHVSEADKHWRFSHRFVSILVDTEECRGGLIRILCPLRLQFRHPGIGKAIPLYGSNFEF
jgi:hypothetical protein